MESKIYVRLIGEGTVAYRPVSATKINDDVFTIMDDNDYDREDEQWEFEPGAVVIVEEKELDGEFVLLAIKSCKN